MVDNPTVRSRPARQARGTRREEPERYRGRHAHGAADHRSPGRRYGWLVASVVLGMVLLFGLLSLSPGVSLPFEWAPGDDADAKVGVPAAAASPSQEPGATPTGPTVLTQPALEISATPTVPPGEPSATPSVSPSATPTPTATPVSPITSPPPPQPQLLGPASGGGVEQIVDRYCVREVSGGSWADARQDGRWECDRFLASATIVSMDAVCAEAYGSGAFARTSNADNAYAWRCYRL